MKLMRTAYREHLEDFAEDLIIMCDTVSCLMMTASSALLRGSLQDAEDALSMADNLADLQNRCQKRAMQLLALEGPVAGDLRQVLSSIYVVEDFTRMAALGMHVAKSARRRHPENALPDDVVPYFDKMAQLISDMSAQVRQLLEDPNAEFALKLTRTDDEVDSINEDLLAYITGDAFDGTNRQAVDMALLSRFYERYADHCVNVAEQVIFLTSGMLPDEYRNHDDVD